MKYATDHGQRPILVLSVLWSVFVAVPTLSAEPMIYTMAGNLTGTVGTTTLTNAPFVWTFISDTTAINTTGLKAGQYQTNETSFSAGAASSINITGVGNATATDPLLVSIDTRAAKGTVTMSNPASTFGIQITDPADIDTWLLANPIGPISGAAQTLSTTTLNTSLGPLNLTGASNVTFQAQYGPAFPHLAMGPLGSDVWTAAIILNNTTAGSASYILSLYQDNGQPLTVGIFDENSSEPVTQNGANVTGTLSPKSTTTIVLSSSTFVEGWGTLIGPGVSGQAVFHRHTSSGADYEATVPLSTGGTEFYMPYDATSFYNGTSFVAALPYITGMALVNLDTSNTATIDCTILTAAGPMAGMGTPVVLPPLGHQPLQVNAATGYSGIAGTTGTLDCSSNGTAFAVLGLRFLGGNDLTSFAAIKIK